MLKNIRYADMHCDTLTELEKESYELFDNRLHISLKKAKAYSFYCQVFAVWTPDELLGNDRFLNLVSKHNILLKELEKNPELMLCKGFADLQKAIDENKTAAFFAIEGAGALDGKLQNLLTAYDMGVRFITLTWNGKNELADGVMCENPGGLTDFGKEALLKMEELSIIPDVSHLCEKAFWELCEVCKKPFAATHSNAKSVCQHPRNLTDEQLILMKERGNLVGINIYSPFLTLDVQNAAINDIIKHTDHMLSLGMENNIALGCDFDGVDSLPKGIENVGDVYKIYDLLVHSYGENLADKICFKNFYEFIKRNLK